MFGRIDACQTGRCHSNSATAGIQGAAEIKITNLDLKSLQLSKERQQAVQKQLAGGYWVMAVITPGPKGPAGEGTTLAVGRMLEAGKKGSKPPSR